jgi:hypothetical protein
VHERGQTKYQVRFGWGVAGAVRIARDAHLVVWVDVLPTADAAVDAADADAAAAAVAELLPDGPEVVLAGLPDAGLVAERVLRLQADRGDRCVVLIVAAGIDGSNADGSNAEGGAPDFAVEDLLAAGAVVDALAERGIDFASPEAAAACAAYTGLRRAVRHLVTASVSATMLDAAGQHDRVEAALAATPGELRVVRGPQREQTLRA